MSNSSETSGLPILRLAKDADRRLRNGHLWVYSNQVDNKATPLKQFASGEQVIVENQHGKILGNGYINPHSLISARLLTRGNEPFNQKVLVSRIESALRLRDSLYAQPFYRLIFGESDLLPGLVVDRFGAHLVVQLNTAGMDLLRDRIIAALIEVLKPESILLRNDSSVRELEGLESEIITAHGTVPEEVELTENDVKFRAPLQTGQKTGWYFDQRPNRAWLRDIVKGKRVLDVFSYVGSFGIQAGVFGAATITCVDSSAPALQKAQENAELNNIGKRLTTLQGDAFDQLKALIDGQERYDVIIVDPPAFIKRKKDEGKGTAAYKRINELAMRLLNREGILLASSCSMHLPRDEMTEIVRSGAVKLDRHAQILAEGMQGADHPVHPAIPETRYLKSILARVI